MASVEIQGILCHYRDKEFGEEILYENLPKDEQFFKLESHPFTDDELVAIANKEHKYNSIQAAWVERQEKVFNNGLYAYINGILRFVPGAYWCYINFWTLENGEKPEYREDDRVFFLFHEYLRLDTNSLGLTRLKGRRQGATSIAMFFMWFIAGRNEFKNCGLTSFSDTAAGDAFQLMFMYGFKSLLPCFQADFDSDSENFIRFVKPVDKKKKSILAVKREGLNSYCNYKSNMINSYDSGRQSYNVPDESGKRNKLNINSYWSRLYKTMLVGSNKVGFCYSPTTVGAAAEGGENYQLFYKNANQYKIDKLTGEPVGINTDNRMVRYLVTADKCYKGYIDKFGNSIDEDPKVPTLTNEGKWVTEGARTILLRERARLEGNQLMEHRRDYPLNEYDAFSFTLGNCEFSEKNIREQLDKLHEDQPYLRQARTVVNKEVIKSIFPDKPDKEVSKISFMDDAKGGLFILEIPNKPNAFSERGGYFEPLNTAAYSIGVDTTQDRIAIDGSNPCIVVFKKSCIVEGIEMGNYPVAIWISPTRLDIHFDEEVLKLCKWYGCRANYELDRRTDFYRYFCKENAQAFLEWTPRVMRNPLKPGKQLEYGTRSGDPFQLAQQLQIGKMYIDGTDNEVYNGNVHRIMFPTLLEELLRYNHLDRTKSDQVIGLFMALAPVFGEIQNPIIPKSARSILPTYKIKMPA